LGSLFLPQINKIFKKKKKGEAQKALKSK